MLQNTDWYKVKRWYNCLKDQNIKPIDMNLTRKDYQVCQDNSELKLLIWIQYPFQYQKSPLQVVSPAK